MATQALASIQNVALSKNPVTVGDKFIISVDVLFYEAENPKRKLPFKLGKRKEVPDSIAW